MFECWDAFYVKGRTEDNENSMLLTEKEIKLNVFRNVFVKPKAACKICYEPF